jgi:hypothetical protein
MDDENDAPSYSGAGRRVQVDFGVGDAVHPEPSRIVE